jgi:hypothetical protein
LDLSAPGRRYFFELKTWSDLAGALLRFVGDVPDDLPTPIGLFLEHIQAALLVRVAVSIRGQGRNPSQSYDAE